MPEEEATTLDEQQASLVEEYLALREQAAADAKAKRKLSRLAGKIDDIYWKRVEELLAMRVSTDSDELAFEDEERLLIDMGLLDLRLVANASDDLPQRLLDELRQPGAGNHLYLSEWLEDRYHRYRLAEDVNAAANEHGEAGEDEATQSQVARRKAMKRLAPLFQGLPGVTREVAGLMVQGGLDEQILRTNVLLLDRNDRKLFHRRRQLWSLRTQVLEKARARAADQATLKVFDLLDEIYTIDWRERFENKQRSEKGEQENEISASAAMSRDKAVAYLVSELRFVKTLLPLGALAGGVTRTRAVLFEDGPRVTKTEVSKGLALAEACDREFDVKSVVLIAPFCGRGIFEWDRDSLVVSLVPVESAEDSVANAVGNCRMLIDSLQREGEMRRAYEEAFPDANYQQAFQADYRSWVTGVGRGDASALAAERRAFFRQHVGPDCSGVLAPANLRNLGPQTREAVRKRLEKQMLLAKPDSNLNRRLAVLYWLDEDYESAMKYMAMAAKLGPGDGVVLFSLGMLLRAQDNGDRARAIFDACAKRVPESIWGVYALDAASGKI